MFRGRASVALDSKGRMAIPTKYRDKLKEVCDGQMVVTRHPSDQCLMLYPLPEWEIKEQALSRAPSLDPRTIQVQRIFIGNATDCEMDGQGRILIPENLRSYADFKKNLALVGLVGKFEIWNSEKWDGGIDVSDTEVVTNLANVPGMEGFTF
ncbi:MAG: division/cell wall cluster transcriptional repressor MraZ [Methylococcales bacterium]